MSSSPRFGRVAAALCLTFGATLAQAGPYSNLYVFGDSLSDSGNDLNVSSGAFPVAAYYTDGSNTGRFTNGLNYADRLAQGLGLALTPSTAGGTNYAYGGARSDYVRPDVAAAYPDVLSFKQQIAQYVGLGAPADPNALYVLWIGSNDMADAIGQSLGLGGDPTPIQNRIGQTLSDLVTGFVTLEALGAKHFAIGNVADLGLTPRVRDLATAFGNPGIAALATGASEAYNNALALTLPAYTLPTSDVSLIDAFGIQRELTQNPAAFGLSNVTSACYDGEADGSPLSGGPTPTVCATPDQYLYFDYEHPTAALHALVAERLMAEVPEPTALSLMFAGLGMLGFSARRRRQG